MYAFRYLKSLKSKKNNLHLDYVIFINYGTMWVIQDFTYQSRL